MRAFAIVTVLCLGAMTAGCGQLGGTELAPVEVIETFPAAGERVPASAAFEVAVVLSGPVEAEVLLERVRLEALDVELEDVVAEVPLSLLRWDDATLTGYLSVEAYLRAGAYRIAVDGERGAAEGEAGDIAALPPFEAIFLVEGARP